MSACTTSWSTSKTAAATAEKYGMKGNLVAGANIAGFEKIASAMMSQGIV